jgi:hypothetical protein
MFFSPEWALLVVRCLRSLGPMTTTHTGTENAATYCIDLMDAGLEAIKKTLESA